MKRNMLKRIHRDMERLNELNVQFEYNDPDDLYMINSQLHKWLHTHLMLPN